MAGDAFPSHLNVGIAGRVGNDVRFNGADQELAGGKAVADDIELSLPVEVKVVCCNMMARDNEGKLTECSKYWLLLTDGWGSR